MKYYRLGLQYSQCVILSVFTSSSSASLLYVYYISLDLLVKMNNFQLLTLCSIHLLSHSVFSLTIQFIDASGASTAKHSCSDTIT